MRTKHLVISCVVMLFGASDASAEQESLVARGDGLHCPIPPSEWPQTWTVPERFAWSQICLGRSADLSLVDQWNANAPFADIARPDADTSEESCSTRTTLSPHFLLEVTTRAPWTQVAAKPAVSIACATFEDGVEISDLVVPVAIEIADSVFADDLVLSDTQFADDLAVVGSRVADGVSLSGARVGGDVLLDATKAARVSLNGTLVEGSVSMSDLETEFLGASQAKVQSFVFATGLRAKGLSFDGATVGKTMSLFGATLGEVSHFTGMSVGEDLVLQQISTVPEGDEVPELLLSQKTEVKGDVLLGGKFTAEIDGSEIRVGGSVQTWGLDQTGGLNFNRARVAGDFDLGIAHINGHVQIAVAQIGGDLVLPAGTATALSNPTDRGWRPRSSLVLFDTHAKRLVARMPESWESDVGQKIPYFINGLTYDSLSRPIDATALVDWVNGDRSPAAVRPQPYQALAATLRTMQSERAARKVDFALRRHQMRTYAPTFLGWLNWGRDLVQWIFFGFGIYPATLFIWFAVLIGVGCFVGRSAFAARRLRWSERLLFSLQSAVPALPHSQRFAGLTLYMGARQRLYYDYQPVIGLTILALFGVLEIVVR